MCNADGLAAKKGLLERRARRKNGAPSKEVQFQAEKSRLQLFKTKFKKC